MPDLVWKRDQNTDTIIYLQNLSGEEVNPKVFFYQRAVAGEAAPAPFEYTATIPPYGTQSIWVSELFTEIDITEWEGSAVVQVDQAMGGVVLTRTNGDEQWATAYNAWANP
jgi:hypothetical protein